MLMNSRTVTVSIARSPKRVYGFASDPQNLPQWLTFITGVQKTDGDWFIHTSDGAMRIRFVPKNEFRILDHAVQLPDRSEVMNPMRVVPNGEGSEVIFTLFQPPSMSDQQFEEDARTVQTDLKKLKSVLESIP